jgi:N6-adenosine-specific RNA methylase IME4
LTRPAAERAQRKRKAEGLEIPAETRAIDPLPPALKLAEHPAAAIFPMMVGDDLAAFNADIRANGVSQPVTLIEVDGVRQMLDGRNRRRAASLAGQACPAELYIGKTPVKFVVARNLRRRHLTEGQKADAAAQIEGFTHGGERRGDSKDSKDAITRAEAAALTGASERSVARAAKVRKLGSPEIIDAMQQGKIEPSVAAQALDLSKADQKRVVEEIAAGRAKTAKQVLKRGRVKARNDKLKAKVLAAPERKYTVIVTDDEWKYEAWSEQGQDRAADMHYSTSAADVLLQRQLAAADDAVYYMWSTVPHQPLAFEVMKARGFTYRSQFAWWKINPGNKPGLGYWSRIEHELLLIGTRGGIACPAPGDNWRSVQLSFAGEHSEKPEWAYRMIEAYHRPLVGTMIEYNARKRRRGWSAWGNEIGLVEPTPAELQAEFDAAPLLPDPHYIELDRSMFTRLFGSAADREKMAANYPNKVFGTLAPADKPLSEKGREAVEEMTRVAAAKLTSSPAAAMKALAEAAAEEPPENPDLRAIWLVEVGRGGEVAATDLKRVIAAGYVAPGRANRKKGDSRPALVSAHGAAELKAWRERMAEEAGELSAGAGGPAAHGEAFFKAEADARGIAAGGGGPVAGQDGDGIPQFLKRAAS